MRLSYLITLLVGIIVSFSSQFFSTRGMEWYYYLKVPSLIQNGALISFIWSVIFVFTMISILIVFNKRLNFKKRILVFNLFLANAFFNIMWSYLFFYLNFIATAATQALLLTISLFLLLYFIWPLSKKAVFILIPYTLTVIFVLYLNLTILTLNSFSS